MLKKNRSGKKNKTARKVLGIYVARFQTINTLTATVEDE